MSKTDAQRAAESRYRKKMRQVVVRFSPHDYDMWEHVRAMGGATYVKRLIREDMERHTP